MAAKYKTPGVYIEENSVLPQSVAQVETAIPAFIGFTERHTRKTDADLHMRPLRISSLKEYEQYYGGPRPESIALQLNVNEDTGNVLSRSVSITNSFSIPFHMHYQLQMYFANGGGPCYIVSCGLYGAGGTAGAINTGMTNALTALEGADEPTLIVFADTPSLSSAQHYTLANKALAQAGKLMDRFVIIDVMQTGSLNNDITNLRGSTELGNNNLSYGAAYYPKINSTIKPHYTDTTATIAVHRINRVDAGAGVTLVGSSLAAIRETDKALYIELKSELDKALHKHELALYPSGAVAGVYASVDSNRGVWKAPANIRLNNIRGVSLSITNEQQGHMNVDAGTGKSINAIRSFTGKGTMVWGARTLAGNDNEWKYVSVRRFYNMVLESTQKATAPFVFEPNNANTWVKVRAMIENFLTLQWREGALVGVKPEHAFFVRVGLGQTMSAQDILEGRMIVETGLAMLRPAEFIILRFTLKMRES